MEKLQQERISIAVSSLAASRRLQFMTEYPITTDYADAAVQSIYAGTNEIMKVFIARRMGLA